MVMMKIETAILRIFVAVFVFICYSSSNYLNRTELVTCHFCDEDQCHCSQDLNSINCSSYTRTFLSDCRSEHIWNFVDFSSRNLQTINQTTLLSLRMHRLSLKSNSITAIEDQIFDPVGDILDELDLSINSISNVSSKWLNSNLSALRNLTLASNQIRYFLVDNDSVDLSSLKVLNLSSNQLEQFPQIIHRWFSLTILDLSLNRLSTIPRFTLSELKNLTWLSVSSNPNLNCLVQDSFKYLKSLKYLDLSGTSLLDFDPCIFVPLSGLRILRMKNLFLNCSSCWLPIARKSQIQLIGQCLLNDQLYSLNTLPNQLLKTFCTKSSIDCSKDHCDAGQIFMTNNSEKLTVIRKTSSLIPTQTPEIILGIIFGSISLLMLTIFIVIVVRWYQGKSICHCIASFRSTGKNNDETRRQRQFHKQVIETNPAVIESVVTHGANLNIPSNSYDNNGFDDDPISNTKRKLFNPMFADSSQNETELDEPDFISEYL